MSSPCLVSNWKMCSTPATRILKNTAVLLLPNCMISRSSAECRYSFGTGLKKWTPRLLTPRISLAGRSPIGSSILLTVKKMELPYGRLRKIRRNCRRASSLENCSNALYLDPTSRDHSSLGRVMST